VFEWGTGLLAVFVITSQAARRITRDKSRRVGEQEVKEKYHAPKPFAIRFAINA